MTLQEEIDDLNANVTMSTALIGTDVNIEAVEAAFSAGLESMRALLGARDRFPDLNDNSALVADFMFCSAFVGSLHHTRGVDGMQRLLERMSYIGQALSMLDDDQTVVDCADCIGGVQ